MVIQDISYNDDDSSPRCYRVCPAPGILISDGIMPTLLAHEVHWEQVHRDKLSWLASLQSPKKMPLECFLIHCEIENLIISIADENKKLTRLSSHDVSLEAELVRSEVEHSVKSYKDKIDLLKSRYDEVLAAYDSDNESAMVPNKSLQRDPSIPKRSMSKTKKRKLSEKIKKCISAKRQRAYNSSPNVDLSSKADASSHVSDNASDKKDYPEYFIEAKRDLIDGKLCYTHFLVKWMGYDRSAATWEPSETFPVEDEVWKKMRDEFEHRCTLHEVISKGSGTSAIKRKPKGELSLSSIANKSLKLRRYFSNKKRKRNALFCSIASRK